MNIKFGCSEFAQVFGRLRVLGGMVLNYRYAVAEPTPGATSVSSI